MFCLLFPIFLYNKYMFGQYLLQNTWMYLSIGLIFILSSTLLVHMVLYATEYTWVSKHSKDTLLATGVSSDKPEILFSYRTNY